MQDHVHPGQRGGGVVHLLPVYREIQPGRALGFIVGLHLFCDFPIPDIAPDLATRYLDFKRITGRPQGTRHVGTEVRNGHHQDQPDGRKDKHARRLLPGQA